MTTDDKGRPKDEKWAEAQEEEFERWCVRQDLERIIDFVISWDAEDASRLAVQLNEARELLSKHKEHDWDWGLNDLSNNLRLALSIRGTKNDQVWPPPWDYDSCEFAWVVDRKGQYLTREEVSLCWFADKWEAGVTCHLDSCVAEERLGAGVEIRR